MTLSNVISTYVVELLRRTQITSASPGWTNTVKDVLVSELGSDFELELEAAIQEKIEELKVTNPEIFEGGKNTTTTSKSKDGFSESKALGLANKGLSIAKNPANIVAEGIRLLPHAALVAFALSLAPLIFDAMTRPGGPLDLRWRRLVQEEVNAFLSRQTQKDTQMGVRQVIVQSKKGFTASNGVNNYNTVRGIREGGLNKEREDRFGIIQQKKGGLNI